MQARSIEIPSVGKRLAAIASAAVLAASTVGAPAAFAALPDGQTGTGTTSLIVKLAKTGEYGGTAATGEFANPDDDGDDLGDNLAFTVPVTINFSAKANGVLEGPSESSSFIENESAYPIRVSALDVDPNQGWSIVEDVSKSADLNAVDVLVGPDGGQVNAAKYLEKGDVTNPSKWNMAAKAESGEGDRVIIHASGHIRNIDKDLSSDTEFAKIKWYVRSGNVA